MKRKPVEVIRHKNVFTLTELLVVIAIIGILASMLLPALRGSLEQAKKIVCKNNLKQIHFAWTGYVNDYDGWIIGSYTDTAPKYFWIMPNDSSHGLDKYTNNLDVFLCPSNLLTTYSSNIPTKYGINAQTEVSPPKAGGAYPYNRITSIKYPSKTIIFCDAGESSVPGRSNYTVNVPVSAGYWHLRSANFIVVDGHIDDAKVSDILGGKHYLGKGSFYTYYND